MYRSGEDTITDWPVKGSRYRVNTLFLQNACHRSIK
jgi:hypothetical protein